MRILAFDIGIKNLAFCILDEKVIALENCNILPPVEAIKCSKCKSKASYKVLNEVSEVFCKRHIPKTHTILKELTLKTPVKILKELVKTHDCIKKEKKEDLFESLSKKYALPFDQPKQANASKLSLELIHDALIRFVDEKWPLFSNATHVLLENQPAYKNPHMKSVQVLLFATLRARYLKMGRTIEYHLVHAKKKSTGCKEGDEGYKDRKNKSEERLTEYLKDGPIYTEWAKSKKRSDMADALCMCIDFLASNK
jgi:hypothetical protein